MTTLAEVLRDEVLDSGTWEKAAETVRAHVRAEDEARGGTLSAEQLENIRTLADGLAGSSIMRDLLTHAAAQGRTNAALESERDEALSIYANMLRERDEARAQLAAMTERAEAAERSAARAANRAEVACSQLAARDARVKELEEERDAARVSAGASRDLRHKAESAMATLRRAALDAENNIHRATRSSGDDPLTDEECALLLAARKMLKDAVLSTPAEHPDTATPTTPETVAAARNAVGLPPLEHPDTAKLHELEAEHEALKQAAAPYLTHDGEAWVSHVGPADTAALRAIRDRMSQPGRIETEAAMAGVLGAVRWVVLGDSGPSGGGETKGEDVCSVCSRPASASQPCPHHPRAPLRKRYTVLVPTTPPATAENVCEHGDHPAPSGQRYCSPGCQECDGTECGEEVECAGVCRAVPTPSTTPEEDWRLLEEELEIDPDPMARTTAERNIVAALARLRDEPRRAAEAMRERCAEYVDVVAQEGGIPAVRDAARLLAAGIRALEVKP